MTERAKKIYRAWEDKWVETYKFPNQEESSLAAAIREIVNEFQYYQCCEEEGVEDYKKKLKEMEAKLEEAYAAIETVKTDLNEVNLLNAKLLYTNKIFRAKNLTESQKVKVLAAFDKAATTKEAKLVYETLSEGLNEKKSSVNESMIGGASKVAGIAPTKKPILEVNDQFARWQTLAGLKK